MNYKVRFNQGAFINVWIDVVEVTETEYDLSGLQAGTDYQFVVLARNIHGWSSASQVFTQRAASTPDKPAPVVITNVGTTISLTWTAPFPNYRVIQEFEVQAWVKTSNQFDRICQG